MSGVQQHSSSNQRTVHIVLLLLDSLNSDSLSGNLLLLSLLVSLLLPAGAPFLPLLNAALFGLLLPLLLGNEPLDTNVNVVVYSNDGVVRTCSMKNSG